jgi:hypothetical protein
MPLAVLEPMTGLDVHADKVESFKAASCSLNSLADPLRQSCAVAVFPGAAPPALAARSQYQILTHLSPLHALVFELLD